VVKSWYLEQGIEMKTIEEYDQDCRKRIETFGFMIQQVGGNGWAYTIGLTPTLGYELVCVGLPPEVTYPVLNDLAAQLKASEVPDEQPIPEISNMPVILRTINLDEAPEVNVLLGTARRLNMAPTKLRQMLWPDPQGHFPGSAEYAFPIPQDLRAIAAEEVRNRLAMERRSGALH